MLGRSCGGRGRGGCSQRLCSRGITGPGGSTTSPRRSTAGSRHSSPPGWGALFMAVPLGLGTTSTLQRGPPPCIAGRFRSWFSSEDENSEPRHGRKQPGVLLKTPRILHGSHHIPHCEGLSDAAAIVHGTRVSTYQVEGTWGGHVTHEPPSGSLHTAV